MEPKPEEIVNTRIALLEKRMEKLEMDISEINEEMSMFRSIIHTMSETNHMQLEVRGVMYDIAPKKILGENGEVMSESNGYLEKMIRLAKKIKKLMMYWMILIGSKHMSKQRMAIFIALKKQNSS